MLESFAMLTFLVAALVAISAMGREATHPVVLFLYRSLLFAIALWCARDLHKNRSFSVSPGFLGLGTLACLLMMSFLRNPSTFEGFYLWYQFVLFAVMFVLLAAQMRSQSFEWKHRLLWLVVAIQSVYLIAALIIGRRPITAGFVNPNYFASFLLVGFSICLSMALFRTERVQRAFGLAGAVLFYYGITQAWSRGATIAALAVTAFAILRYAGRFSISRRRMATILAGLAMAGALASPALVRKFTDAGNNDPYNYMRPKIWAEAARLIAQNPVFGAGLGQFFHLSHRYAPALEGGIARYLKRPAIAHSEYLQYAAETGLAATLLLIGLSAWLVCVAARRTKTGPPESRAIQEAALLVALALAMHGLVDNNWTVPVIAAGLIVFALADVLPYYNGTLGISWTPAKKLVSAIVLVIVYAHSTLIPSAGLWFNESGHQASIASNFKKAESDYTKAVSILPFHSAVLDNAGGMYLDRYTQTHEGKWLDVAEDFFARAIEANPDAEEPLRHMERVLIQRLTGDVETDRYIHPKIAAIDRALLRVDPFNPFVRKNLAEALYITGQRNEAEYELARALEFEPNYVPGYLTIARWKNEQDNSEQGQQYLQKAIAVVTKYKDFKTNEPYEALLLGRPTGEPK